jgi:type IV secretory pathway VirD2 relaxase
MPKRLRWLRSPRGSDGKPWKNWRRSRSRIRSLRIPRDYIRSGIRFHAENLATEALGFRTERDAAEARQREITQARYTSLDRIIQGSNDGQSSSFTFTTDITAHGLSDREQSLHQDLSARLAHLITFAMSRTVAGLKPMSDSFSPNIFSVPLGPGTKAL